MSNPLESWTEEQRSALMYRACAEAESGTPRAEMFTRLAGEAQHYVAADAVSVGSLIYGSVRNRSLLL